MYIIRPPPMSTRLAKDSGRAVVASEQASTMRASNFTTMYFMVVRLSTSIHLLDVRQLVSRGGGAINVVQSLLRQKWSRGRWRHDWPTCRPVSSAWRLVLGHIISAARCSDMTLA